MYYYLEIESAEQTATHIFKQISDGWQSFPDIESNTGPERLAYLEWLTKGNEPLPFVGEV